MERIKVLVSGACGRMGQEVIKAVLQDPELQLVGAVDRVQQGKDIGEIVGIDHLGVTISDNLTEAFKVTTPQVMVDFSTPASVMENTRLAIKTGVYGVIGTTGISPEDLDELRALVIAHQGHLLVAPNFAIGALLMMRFAAVASKYFPSVEIIELHHDRKLDAPSGTAIKTAEMILDSRKNEGQGVIGEEKIKGVRGGEMGGIHLHSIRLPGLIAHQEVIFGGEGQTLTIRHDSMSRESFMPGVVLGIKRVMELPGLIYGLDQILFN